MYCVRRIVYNVHYIGYDNGKCGQRSSGMDVIVSVTFIFSCSSLSQLVILIIVVVVVVVVV